MEQLTELSILNDFSSSKFQSASTMLPKTTWSGLSLSWYQFVVIRVSYCYYNEIMTESKLGRKGFIWLTLPHCGPSLKDVSTGTEGG